MEITMDHKRNEKKAAWRSVIFICMIILVFSVADLFNEERFFSEAENRILADKPELTKENLLSGEYMTDYETYLNDQFVSRDIWIRMKTGMDMLLQKKEINGVYLAENDYLIEQHLPEDFPQKTVEKKVALLQKLVEAFPKTEVMLVPTADNILTDKLPEFAPYYDDKALIDQVAQTIGEDRVINVYNILKEHKDEDIYYRTDHHWTTLGAYYAYQVWADKKVGMPAKYDPQELVTVTEDFKGTIQAKLNMEVEGEKIQVFPQTLEQKVKIKYDFMEETDSFYEDSHLDTKNKYGYFLDDNHGLVEIDIKRVRERTLFVIKDSYANTFLPLIANHYSKIYVLDLRYFNGNLFDFMKQYDNGKMEILVLYNCAHFITDFQYY